MRSTASLRPFESPESGCRRAAPEPRLAVWQTCLLAGGSSLLLWGLIGSVAWHLLG
jgi:hypothetical protein